MIVVSSKGFISMAGQGHTDHAVPSYYPSEMGSLSSLPSRLNIFLILWTFFGKTYFRGLINHSRLKSFSVVRKSKMSD